MARLNTTFLTFNCAREVINTSYFAASIAQGLSGQLPPDLIVLSLQEIAPISYAFLGGSFLAPYLDRFAVAINEAAQAWDSPPSGLQYETVLASNVGMTAIMLLAKPEIAHRINWIETAGTGVGVWEMGNKGAVGARLGYAAQDAQDDVVMTFVAAHLAPMEDACDRRNQDWRVINENLVFTQIPHATDARTKAIKDPGHETEPLLSSATDQGTKADGSTAIHTLINPSSYAFVGGDLNYRASDLPPHPDDHHTWPKADASPGESQHFSNYLDKDQLTRERDAGRTLHGLSEAPIAFQPTYKYSSKAQDQAHQLAELHASGNTGSHDGDASSMVPRQPDWLWAKHRHPSWCDRILYLDPTPTVPDARIEIHKYASLPLQPTSDHQPVLLHFSVPLLPLPKPSSGGDAWVSPPFPVRPDWAERRVAARRREIAVGILAYLSLTWEGRTLLVGALIGVIGGWAVLKSLLV